VIILIAPSKLHWRHSKHQPYGSRDDGRARLARNSELRVKRLVHA